MSEQFKKFMTAIDSDLLEEATQPAPVRKRHPWPGLIAAAACLLLVCTAPLLRAPAEAPQAQPMPASGYAPALPPEAQNIRHEDGEAVSRTSFTLGDTAYTLQSRKADGPQAPEQSGEVLCWNARELSMQMASSSGSTSVSWYTQEDGTAWQLTAQAGSLEVLTTASQILRETGLNVAAAPEGAENITYNAFLLDGLTVAETTFTLDGTAWSYRMAATAEIAEDFADISGLELPGTAAGTSVGWCSARSLCHEGQGKLLWFDVVPGLLYSLTMDSNAGEEVLLDMAADLFVPAQGDS